MPLCRGLQGKHCKRCGEQRKRHILSLLYGKERILFFFHESMYVINIMCNACLSYTMAKVVVRCWWSKNKTNSSLLVHDSSCIPNVSFSSCFTNILYKSRYSWARNKWRWALSMSPREHRKEAISKCNVGHWRWSAMRQKNDISGSSTRGNAKGTSK